MLPTKNRIGKGFLPDILRQSRPFNSAYFVLRVHLRGEEEVPYPRIAIVISKKVAKRAVDRHLIKRRISAILERLVKQLKISDLVFLVQKNTLELSTEDLEKELLGPLKEAKILK